MALRTPPVHIGSGGFGTVYKNYRGGEPDILTKFFGYVGYDTYIEEKQRHLDAAKEFGITDLTKPHPFLSIISLGQPVDAEPEVNVGIVKYPKDADAPGNAIVNPSYGGYYQITSKVPRSFPVIRMHNVGTPLRDSGHLLSFGTVLKIFEVIAIFHFKFAHNDMKFDNLVISPAGSPCVIDLGEARAYPATGFAYDHRKLGSFWSHSPNHALNRDQHKEWFTSQKLSKTPGAYTAWETFPDIKGYLTQVWDEFFSKAPSAYNRQHSAMTNDLYGLGVHLENLFSTGVTDPGRRNQMIEIGGDTAGGAIKLRAVDVVRRLVIIMTCPNPNLRMPAVVVAKFFHVLNPGIFAAGSAEVKIKSEDGKIRPYFNASVFPKGAIPGDVMRVSETTTSVVTDAKIKSYLALLAFLIQKDDLFGFLTTKMGGTYPSIGELPSLMRAFFVSRQTYDGYMRLGLVKAPAAAGQLLNPDFPLFDEASPPIKIIQPPEPAIKIIHPPAPANAAGGRAGRPPLAPAARVLNARRFQPNANTNPQDWFHRYHAQKFLQDQERKAAEKKAKEEMERKKNQKMFDKGDRLAANRNAKIKQKKNLGLPLAPQEIVLLAAREKFNKDMPVRRKVGGGHSVSSVKGIPVGITVNLLMNMNPASQGGRRSKTQKVKPNFKVRKSAKTRRQYGGNPNNFIPRDLYNEDQIKSIRNSFYSASMNGRINILYEYYIQYLPKNIQEQLLQSLFNTIINTEEIILEVEEGIRANQFNNVINNLEKKSVEYLNDLSDKMNIRFSLEEVKETSKFLIKQYLGFSNNLKRYRFLLDFDELMPSDLEGLTALGVALKDMKSGVSPFYILIK